MLLLCPRSALPGSIPVPISAGELALFQRPAVSTYAEFGCEFLRRFVLPPATQIDAQVEEVRASVARREIGPCAPLRVNLETAQVPVGAGRIQRDIFRAFEFAARQPFPNQ